jgi:hypothetical protein
LVQCLGFVLLFIVIGDRAGNALDPGTNMTFWGKHLASLETQTLVDASACHPKSTVFSLFLKHSMLLRRIPGKDYINYGEPNPRVRPSAFREGCISKQYRTVDWQSYF